MARSLRIAVADDEPEVLDYFVKALTKSGHQVVVTASNGRDLVDQCQSERPDLLITDIRMDGLSGIEAMRMLASDEPLPTIFISAHYQREDVDGEVEGQVIAFLRKPVKLAELIATVADAADKLK